MIRNIKSIFLSLSIIAFVLCITTTVTYAYWLNNATLTNQLTIANTGIKVYEEFENPTFVPGENAFLKSVAFQNVGTIPEYIRCQADFSDFQIKAKSKISNDNGTTWYPANEYNSHLPEGWIYNSDDNFYYYTTAVAPGEKTVPLFTNVSTTFESAADIQAYDIIVLGECAKTKDKYAQSQTYTYIWNELDGN